MAIERQGQGQHPLGIELMTERLAQQCRLNRFNGESRPLQATPGINRGIDKQDPTGLMHLSHELGQELVHGEGAKASRILLLQGHGDAMASTVIATENLSDADDQGECLTHVQLLIPA